MLHGFRFSDYLKIELKIDPNSIQNTAIEISFSRMMVSAISGVNSSVCSALFKHTFSYEYYKSKEILQICLMNGLMIISLGIVITVDFLLEDRGNICSRMIRNHACCVCLRNIYNFIHKNRFSRRLNSRWGITSEMQLLEVQMVKIFMR